LVLKANAVMRVRCVSAAPPSLSSNHDDARPPPLAP
jgi:hypothetical protein